MAIPPGGYSVPEFRAIHHYGERTYKALKAAGLAPKETLMPESQFSRILPEDYAAWLKLISDPDCQLKEFLRRHERYSAQGRQASQSSGHPAQIWAKFKKLKLTKEKAAPKPRGSVKRLKMQAAE